jgi:molybdenum cofactor guanylyltransferase
MRMAPHPPLPGGILAAVILAGGLSRRMGQGKHGIMLAGRPMLEHLIDRLTPQAGRLAINCNGAALHQTLPCIADPLADHPGPLAGIAAAMQFARTSSNASHVLTVPVDTPFIPADLCARLLAANPAYNVVVVARSNGRTHPVIGLWPVALQNQITEWLSASHNPKLMAFLEKLPVVEVVFPMIETRIGPLDPFFNVNTPEDLLQAENYLEALKP